MSIKGIALHELIWEQRFEELSNQIFPDSAIAHCDTCGTAFVVLLTHYRDGRNGEYVGELERRITEDCRGGLHSLTEIRLEVDP
ncbi:MAG: hypothetical protein ABSD20_04795 [Terriglobales bacterium]|jgi:hypothetical protein